MRYHNHRAKLAPRIRSYGAALLLLFFSGSFSAMAVGEATTERASYERLTQDYFSEQSLRFARELLLKEEYLGLIYGSTVEELKKRRHEGLNLNTVYSPLWNCEPLSVNRSDSTPGSAGLGGRFETWRDYEEREFQRRHELIMQIRAQMMALGSAEQKERLFKSELFTALRYYGRSDWEIAKLLFDRLILDYDYGSLDDILYYQGLTCMQLGQWDYALEQFLKLLDTCPSSAFRTASYDQATAILQAFGNGREIRRLYDDYLTEDSPGEGSKTGGIHVRAAHAQMALGHYSAAVETLKRIHPDSPYYLASRYLLADCLTALEEWSSAVEPLTAIIQSKRKDTSLDRYGLMKDEAQIKLAYIYYQWGDYQKAAEYFDKIKDSSPLYDRMVLGQAWIAYQLDQYPESIAKSEQLLKKYPLSTEIYEAAALAGYCYEQMGDKDAATVNFLDVLNAGVGRTELQSFLEERRRISETMAELKAMEEQVFSANDEALFEQYQQVRHQLWICQKRIALAELMKVNAKMRALVEERVALDSLLRAHGNLESDVFQADQRRWLAEFAHIEDRLHTILGHLNVLGEKQIQKTPLYYKESQIAYLNTRADSLSGHLEKEIGKLKAAISETENLKQEALRNGDVPSCLDLGMRLDRLNNSLDLTFVSQTQAEKAQRPALMTRVDRWSDFSFSRYAMGGMDLEELERKRERLRQVEEYLATLEELIGQSQVDEPAQEAIEQP